MAGFWRSLFGNRNKQHTSNASSQRPAAKKAEDRAKKTGIRTVERTLSMERKEKEEVGKEDFLLNQIDEFRMKAEQLQEMLRTKEGKLQELQTNVSDKEEKAEALNRILNEKQKEADELSEIFEKQIDALIAKVTGKLGEFEEHVSTEMKEGRKVDEEEAAMVRAALGQIQAQLEAMKSELGDRVHTENVKCFRNIQDLFKGMDDKLDALNFLSDKVKKAKSAATGALVFGILNMVLILGMIALFLVDKLGYLPF